MKKNSIDRFEPRAEDYEKLSISKLREQLSDLISASKKTTAFYQWRIKNVNPDSYRERGRSVDN